MLVCDLAQAELQKDFETFSRPQAFEVGDDVFAASDVRVTTVVSVADDCVERGNHLEVEVTVQLCQTVKSTGTANATPVSAQFFTDFCVAQR